MIRKRTIFGALINVATLALAAQGALSGDRASLWVLIVLSALWALMTIGYEVGIDLDIYIKRETAKFND